MARKYELRERAESVAETRARIVEATVALHAQLGPARTTITAIADRANVQRLTVYRHFPDELSLFRACSAHWTSRNPRPDTTSWQLIGDPRAAAVGSAAGDLRVLPPDRRDDRQRAPRSAGVRSVARGRRAARRVPATRTGVLAEGWQVRGRKRTVLNAVIGHAIAFETWRSLTGREGLSDQAAAEAMVEFVSAVAD